MKLRTKLSLAECRERLGSATDLRGLALSWDGEGPGTVVGEFRGSMFRLHTRKYYNNAFAPFFYGKLTEADGGAILEGGFRMNPFVRLSMLFLISWVRGASAAGAGFLGDWRWQPFWASVWFRPANGLGAASRR